MPTLSEDPTAQNAVRRILAQTYGRQAQAFGVLDALVERLGTVEVESALAALDAHITDTTDENGQAAGHWMPKAADILAHVKRIESTERKRLSGIRQSAPMGDGSRKINVPRVVFDAETGRPRISGTMQVTSWPNQCRECADRGIARFVYDPADHRRVWLASEALELPLEMIWRLKYGDAVCDCPRGHRREESQWRVVKWSKMHGTEVEMPVFPRMRTIRTLADQRRKGEVAVVDAPAVDAPVFDAPEPVAAMAEETL